MGTRGPVPKRTAQRRRTNAPADGATVTTAPGADNVPEPDEDPSWHPIALEWYRSLALSGQSRFYEPSDWQVARYVAQAMSVNLSAGRFSAQLFAAVLSAMTNLLATEGDRRRLRLELERGEATNPDGDRAAATVTELFALVKDA